METSLAGRLLVATPQITTQVFRRGVVLLLHHDTAGAHGLLLNKPIGVDVDRVLPGWGEQVCSPRELFQGGPVSLDTALGLAWLPGGQPPSSVHLLFGAVGVVDLDVRPEDALPGAAGMRVFAGYSGWSENQLEEEIDEGSWYVVDSTPEDVFCLDPAVLWRAVLRRQPGRLAFVAHYPDDPEWN
ncbi:YqgE/AlgH family protein [Austwickia chelonae]|uniref:YqgE/AlgH family protein n=1 Tax=Austwickia chelonae TaxID=100225 RepID=UPI000E23D311|nr:YqgE/AlgH family protein [Austwickia chelonae]